MKIQLQHKEAIDIIRSHYGLDVNSIVEIFPAIPENNLKPIITPNSVVELVRDIDHQIRNGNKIAAIKLLRDYYIKLNYKPANNSPLKCAKDVIENWTYDMSKPSCKYYGDFHARENFVYFNKYEPIDFINPMG